MTKIVFGLFLYAVGSYLSIQANIGLSPWNAFSVGLSGKTGLSVGTMISLVGVVILVLDLALKEKIGLGTVLDTFLIGMFLDALEKTNIVPVNQNFGIGIIMLLAGQVCICFGSYYYISPAMGCGPRDSLMIALGKRLPQVPIGLIRSGIEAAVLVIGWALGAKVGLGTVITVFGIGFILQGTFRLLRFDVKAVEHESLIGTAQVIRKAITERGKPEQAAAPPPPEQPDPLKQEV